MKYGKLSVLMLCILSIQLQASGSIAVWNNTQKMLHGALVYVTPLISKVNEVAEDFQIGQSQKTSLSMPESKGLGGQRYLIATDNQPDLQRFFRGDLKLSNIDNQKRWLVKSIGRSGSLALSKLDNLKISDENGKLVSGSW